MPPRTPSLHDENWRDESGMPAGCRLRLKSSRALTSADETLRREAELAPPATRATALG